MYDVKHTKGKFVTTSQKNPLFLSPHGFIASIHKRNIAALPITVGRRCFHFPSHHFIQTDPCDVYIGIFSFP